MRRGDLALTWRRTFGEIPDWLWTAAFPKRCEGRFWYEAVERGTLARQFEFFYGCLTRDGVPIGIVPAFCFDVPLELVIPPSIARYVIPIARGPLRWLAFQRTLFVGNVAGEEGYVGLVPGVSLAEVVDHIHREARVLANSLRAPMLVWKDFAEPDRPALDALLQGGRPFRIPSYPGTAIAIDPAGFAAFLAQMRSDRRHKIRTKLRKGKAAIPAAVSIETHPDEPALREMFALFEQTRSRATTRFETITLDFFRCLAGDDTARFIVLREAGSNRMLAFMIALHLRERVINQFIGLDYAVAEAGRLYFQLFEAAYDWAASVRARVMHSGQTAYMAKLDLGHRLVPLWNFCEHRNPVVNALFRRLARTISWDTLDPQLAEYLQAHPEVRPQP